MGHSHSADHPWVAYLANAEMRTGGYVFSHSLPRVSLLFRKRDPLSCRTVGLNHGPEASFIRRVSAPYR